jgi:hypothetical protein
MPKYEEEIRQYRSMWKKSFDEKEFPSGDYNLRRIYILLDMAQRNIKPDGTFSDMDVDLYFYFRAIMKQIDAGNFER